MKWRHCKQHEASPPLCNVFWFQHRLTTHQFDSRSATKSSPPCPGEGLADRPRLHFADEPLSGSGSDRPDLQHLLAAARRSPRPFDVILVDDTSRISRSMADAARIREELNFLGVRLVAVSQNIDSDDEQSDVMMTVHGLVDSLYIKELAKKTHEAVWVVNDAPGLRILSQ